MKVAVVGGTGSFGRALAGRLRDLGHEVAIGSRDADRAQERAAVLGVTGGTNAVPHRVMVAATATAMRAREDMA